MIRSLRARVTLYVLAVILVIVVPLGILSYRKTVHEFDELADARLVQATRTIDVLAENAGLRNPQPGSPLDVMVWHSPFQEPTVTQDGHAYEVRLGFQYWNANDQLRVTSDNFQGVSLNVMPIGFSDEMVGGGRWRVFTLREADGDTVRVAERYDGRNAVAQDLLWEHVAPMLITLPVLVILVGWAVHRALRPLNALSQTLSARDPEDSAPIELPEEPREIEPVRTALNGLLNRARAALDRERQFTADAAHQLRTPLAAGLLHLENAIAADSAESRNLALGRAQESLGRLRRLVNQFLELARWDSAEDEPKREVVDLEACVHTEVEEAALLAADKDIEISVNSPASRVLVIGWEPALRALARNLIDNAFRYTLVGGCVEVRLSVVDGGALLEISDSGPGIALQERERVLQRFRRGDGADVTGYGLGLPIVCRIAELHGATVALRDSSFGQGLCVAVRFPVHTSLSLLHESATE